MYIYIYIYIYILIHTEVLFFSFKIFDPRVNRVPQSLPKKSFGILFNAGFGIFIGISDLQVRYK